MRSFITKSTWFLTASVAASGYAASVGPNTQTVQLGTVSGTVSNLLVAGDSRYVSLTSSGGKKIRAFYGFNISGTESLSLQTAFYQARASDTYQFAYKNSSGKFVSFLKISGSPVNAYKNLQKSLPLSAIVQGKVTLRLISNDGAANMRMDRLTLETSSVTPNPTPTPAPTPTPTPTPIPVASYAPGTTWYWQLQGTLDTSKNVKIYDIDLYDTSAATMSSLKASGKTVVCYFSAGSYENWRADANRFPAAALGNNLDGWPGERWLDVRNSTVRSIMADRMDMAKAKGCDALEPDNVDGYQNNPGFSLTRQDQINYLTYLADQAHAKGLKIALKNATDLVTALVDKFDFAVVEECFKYNECEMYSPFINKGKAVLNAEYSGYSSNICSRARELKFSTVFFNLDLNGRVFNPCP